MNNQKGFTLIELLVSVTIIGILASMSVSNMEEFRERVYQAEQSSLFHSLNIALTTSATENDPEVTGVDLLADTWYNTTTWTVSGGTLSEILPGFPYNSVSLDYRLIARDYDCTAAAGSCWDRLIQVANCRDGTYLRTGWKKDGTSWNAVKLYLATYDAAC